MIALEGAAILLVVGIAAIVLFVFKWLHPRHAVRDQTRGYAVRPDSFAGMATCRFCSRRIHGCRCNGGVPSTWVHAETHRRQCTNGDTFAEHR
jgi:hypothetical protein